MTKKKSALKRRIPVFLSDTHGGHKLGLMNPEVVLIDEGSDGEVIPYSPAPTATQSYLWDCYTEDITGVQEFAGDDEIILFHVGDATQGNKYPQHLVSTRMADQVTIAVANLRPFVSLPNVKIVRLAKGTGSHVFDEGSSEILIVNQLRAEFPEKDISVAYHGVGDVDGVSIDYAHHGPFPGSREWLRGNVARYYLRDLMMREIMAEHKPPDLVVRAHYHTIVAELLEIRANGTVYESRLLVLPSYCGMGEHAHKATRSVNKITNGLVAYEVASSELSKRREFVRSLDIRTKEVL